MCNQAESPFNYQKSVWRELCEKEGFLTSLIVPDLKYGSKYITASNSWEVFTNSDDEATG